MKIPTIRRVAWFVQQCLVGFVDGLAKFFKAVTAVGDVLGSIVMAVVSFVATIALLLLGLWGLVALVKYFWKNS